MTPVNLDMLITPSAKETSESKLRRIYNTIAFRNQALRILHHSDTATRGLSPRTLGNSSLIPIDEAQDDDNESVFDEPELRDYVSALKKKGSRLIRYKGRSNSQA